MRTTVSIDDELLAAAKHRAHQRNQTLGQLVEAALRRELNRADDLGAPPPIPVFRGGGGVRPGVDLTSNRAIYELLDEGVALDKRH